MAGIALFFLNNDARAKRGIFIQAVPAFEKQDSEAISFLQHNRVNPQLLDFRAKFIQRGLYFVGSRHGGSSREGGRETGPELAPQPRRRNKIRWKANSSVTQLAQSFKKSNSHSRRKIQTSNPEPVNRHFYHISGVGIK